MSFKKLIARLERGQTVKIHAVTFRPECLVLTRSAIKEVYTAARHGC